MKGGNIAKKLNARLGVGGHLPAILELQGLCASPAGLPRYDVLRTPYTAEDITARDLPSKDLADVGTKVWIVDTSSDTIK